MNKQLENQRKYWDSTVGDFDSIYSHGKSKFQNWLDATFRWDMYARFDYTMQHSEQIAGKTILEVGCGTGRFVFEYLKRGAKHVTGIDIAENMLAICRQRAQAKSVSDRSAFVQADLLKYQPDAKFDNCIGIGLFDYIPDALPVLIKMREVTSDRVIVSLPRFWTWRAPVRKARLALKGCDVYFYTKERIDALMKQVGQLYCVTAYV
jgi:ubiquinone/menaquinone biosynthesis C-methylase UbiE